MSNVKFKSVPAQAWANNQSGHYYSTELIPWFRASGQPADYPNEFVPDIGSKFDFTVTHDASSYNYIYDKTDPFWPVEGDFDKGFSIQTPEISSLRQFNYRIAGGKGYWMPAPIFRSLSFYWGNESNNAKSWYVKHTALVLKNWKTDEEKTWGFGMNNTSKSSRVVILNTVDEVRAMGPDWFVYGVIFNLRTDATSDLLIGKGRLVDFRLGHECARPAGTNRLILPKQMTWGNFTNAMKAGQMKYEPIPVEIPKNHNRFKLNIKGSIATENRPFTFNYDTFDSGIPSGPDLDGKATVYPPNTSSGFTSDITGSIRFVTTDKSGNLVAVENTVTYYFLNPQTGFRFYVHSPKPSQEAVDLLQEGADVYVDLDY